MGTPKLMLVNNLRRRFSPAPDLFYDQALRYSPDGKTLAWIGCGQSVRLLSRSTIPQGPIPCRCLIRESIADTLSKPRR